MNEEIIIRKVKDEDFEDLVQLYEDVWPSVDYDKRKKANFIINESNGINYCAEYGGRLVGSRTSCPFNFNYGDRRLNTVQVGDSCVHPSCRGKGIFLKMNEAFLKDFFSKENGGELIYNISVYASRKAYEKLGWHYIESLMALRKFVHPFRLFTRIGFNPKRLFVPIKWDKRNDVIKIDPILLEVREKLFCGNKVLHVNYDLETFRWRLKSESGIKWFSEKQIGGIIYKIGYRDNIREVEIGEVFLYEYTKRNFKVLLKQFLKRLNPDILWVLVSEGHPLRKYYGDSWFITNPKQKYLNHGVRVETDEMKEICYNPLNWALSSLDIDTF